MAIQKCYHVQTYTITGTGKVQYPVQVPGTGYCSKTQGGAGRERETSFTIRDAHARNFHVRAINKKNNEDEYMTESVDPSTYKGSRTLQASDLDLLYKTMHTYVPRRVDANHYEVARGAEAHRTRTGTEQNRTSAQTPTPARTEART